MNSLHARDTSSIEEAGGAHARTDAGGAFSLCGLTRGRFWVAAHTPGRIPETLCPVEVPGGPVELRLRRAGVLRVEVEDAAGARRSSPCGRAIRAGSRSATPPAATCT